MGSLTKFKTSGVVMTFMGSLITLLSENSKLLNRTCKFGTSTSLGLNKRSLLNDILCLDEKEGRNRLTSEDRDRREDLNLKWRLATERQAFLRRLVDHKYDSMWGGWCSNKVPRSYGVSFWKNIRKGWDGFVRFTSFQVGDGSCIQF